MKIRILLVIDSLNLGGTEKQCFEIARGLDKERFEVELVTLDKGGPLLRSYVGGGIPVHECKISGGFYRLRSLLQILRLRSFIRKGNYHVVQTHGFFSTVPGVVAARAAPLPPVILAGKRDLNELLPRKKAWVEKRLWNLCDGVVVNAAAVRDRLVRRERVDSGQIFVIPNGLDPGYLESGTTSAECGPFIVGMVGNFRLQKDHRTFLDSAALVLRTHPTARFVCVGDGPTRKSMEEYAESIGVRGSVTFTGRKEGVELVALRKSFTVSVLASRNEGMPNVVMESMALGVPVVANPSGGVEELIEDGETGFLFPYRRPDLLAGRILFLLAHPAALKAMGERARRKMQEGFTMTHMIRRYEDLYGSLTRAKRGGRAGPQ